MCHEYVATHHFLIALSEVGGTVTNDILDSYGLSHSVIVDEVAEFDPMGTMTFLCGKLGHTSGALHAITHASDEAIRIGGVGALITEDHLFLGVIDASEHVVAQILSRRQISTSTLRQNVLHRLGDHMA